jgi:hypothetical protein
LEDFTVRLIVRLGSPGDPGDVVSRNDQFTEPFLPAVGDILISDSGQPATVTARRFAFNAGAFGVQGVELFIG